MLRQTFCAVAVAALAVSCSTTSDFGHETAASVPSPNQMKSFSDFQPQAAKFKNALALPQFETAPDALTATADKTMAEADAALDAIGKLSPGQVNFDNTLGALDRAGHLIGMAMSRIYLIKETSPVAAMRDTATEQVKRLQEWAVGLEYREDVYRAVKAYAETKPKLAGEEAKLLEETLRDYRRAGLALPKAERDEVEKLRT